jgi:rare lipoprotein A
MNVYIYLRQMSKKLYTIVITLFIFCFTLLHPLAGSTQPIRDKDESPKVKKKNITRILYGQASFYAAKFEGRKTANGENFKHQSATAACNVLPLGTWLRVTNLRNNKSIVVKTNDRLHPKTKRIIDLSKSGAQKLGYTSQGLTRVKIEVLKGKP